MTAEEALANKRKSGREWMARDYRRDPQKHRDRVRAAYAKKKAILDADPKHPDHGKNASYTAGCRCTDCTRARRDYERLRQARIRGEA